VEPLDSYEDLNAESSDSSLTIEQHRSRNWVPAALLAAVAIVALVSVLSRSESAGDPVGDDATEATTPPTNEQAAESADESVPAASSDPGAATSTVPPSTPVAGQQNRAPIPVPNTGIDAWLFVVTQLRVDRIDLATGERTTVETNADLSGERLAERGRVGLVGDTITIVGADQVLLLDIDTLTVGALPIGDMQFLAAGDDEIWTSSSTGLAANAIHRLPISGAEPITIDLNMPAPFPFLVAAAVSDGLLVSELLGATWHVDDSGSVTRRDEISSLLASGEGAYLATSCAPNAMLCSTEITTLDGSTRLAVVDNDFSFGVPMSPDGRWLAGPAGFVDLETGTLLPRPQGMFGSNLGSWSADSRWFAEPTAAGARVHDLTGEFESLTIAGIGLNAELQLILR